ncbi:hypothetical protein [Streptomyces celluloflavus]|uniref:hypothetical protein n=1 Tax=Streptomyces celluloflavus TaxID=58344 RepID=UPI0034609584|nr:hypothetical protein OG717_33290 [Streptomyces celluloflavus]
MIRGEKVALRTRRDSDIAVLQAELYEDVATRSRAGSEPWRPLPPDAAEFPAAVPVPSDRRAYSSVVELASQELAGNFAGDDSRQGGLRRCTHDAHDGYGARLVSRAHLGNRVPVRRRSVGDQGPNADGIRAGFQDSAAGEVIVRVKKTRPYELVSA